MNHQGEHAYWVYLMGNRRRGIFYVGITGDVVRRVWQHRNHLPEGSFTSRYNLTHLYWSRQFLDVRAAIAEEKRIKRWHRAWKIALVEECNPEWRDLWSDLHECRELSQEDLAAVVIPATRSASRDLRQRSAKLPEVPDTPDGVPG
jgi:putative endonuclease